LGFVVGVWAQLLDRETEYLNWYTCWFEIRDFGKSFMWAFERLLDKEEYTKINGLVSFLINKLNRKLH